MSQQFSREELDKSCCQVYKHLLTNLGEQYHNWLVAIEPESKEYFLGQDDYEILSRARKKYPKSVFFMYRLAENPAVDHLC